ncbi:MAG: hypothetical protein ACP5LX_06950 [Nitrososphaeria archaeon]
MRERVWIAPYRNFLKASEHDLYRLMHDPEKMYGSGKRHSSQKKTSEKQDLKGQAHVKASAAMNREALLTR